MSSTRNLKRLQEAFNSADEDHDGFLRHKEVQEFGKLMFNKPCPLEVYVGMCKYCGCRPEQGLSWGDVRRLFVDSNKSNHPRRFSNYGRRPSYNSSGSPSRDHVRSRSAGGAWMPNMSKPRQEQFQNGHQRSRSELTNNRRTPRRFSSRSSSRRRSSASSFKDIFERFNPEVPSRDKDRELVNLLLKRLRETKHTIEEKEEECTELKRDLTEQRERRMTAEHHIKRLRQEREAAKHSRASVDVHRDTHSWEKYKLLGDEILAVKEATNSVQDNIKTVVKKIDNLKSKRNKLEEENRLLRKKLENSGVLHWERRLEQLRGSILSETPNNIRPTGR